LEYLAARASAGMHHLDAGIAEGHHHGQTFSFSLQDEDGVHGAATRAHMRNSTLYMCFSGCAVCGAWCVVTEVDD
jgi:hypothetical protein